MNRVEKEKRKWLASHYQLFIVFLLFSEICPNFINELILWVLAMHKKTKNFLTH
jgi:hypothetical protein